MSDYVISSGATTSHLTAAFSENVTFTGASGQLELAQSQAYTGTVTGFSLTGGTSLDLRDITFTGATKATYVDNGFKTAGVLTVTDGTHVAHITLVGNYSSSVFNVSADSGTGTLVVDPVRRVHGPPSHSHAPAGLFVQALAGFPAGRGSAPALHGGLPGTAPALLAVTTSGR